MSEHAVLNIVDTVRGDKFAKLIENQSVSLDAGCGRDEILPVVEKTGGSSGDGMFDDSRSSDSEDESRRVAVTTEV